MKLFLFILLIIVCIVTGIFLPYIHGDYDYFAIGLSHIFQFAAFASLLLVPIGLIWIILALARRKKTEAMIYSSLFKRLTLAVSGIIILAAALGSFVSHNRFSAIIILGIGAYFLFKISRGVKALNTSRAPYYFFFIPLAVVCFRMAFLEKVKNKSTDFVIHQSAALIEDIEAYKRINGHYPISLQSTIEDYKTFVSGIERFHYELNGEAFNLYFEQFSDIIGTQEIVMYNPLDEHEMTVHNQDLLRIDPDHIFRGYHQVVKLPQSNWKAFYFD